MKNHFEIRGEITAIYLTRKDGTIVETIIDTIDLDKVKEYQNTWFASFDSRTNSFYVQGSVYVSGKRIYVPLHRLLMGESSLHVDHINHDTLDNRRSCNLRWATQSQNNQNKKGAQVNSKSGIRGVHWQSKDKKWVASICVNNKSIYLGSFSDVVEAERIVTEARAKYMPFSQEYRAVSS